MFRAHEDMWERFAPLVAQVEKPSRYLGQEWGAVEPDEKPGADYHAVMIYPDVYEIGQANQAVAILYDSLNGDEHIYCERAFLPWTDMISLMREKALPLCSLETFTPVNEFDFVGITLPHELAAANVLETLDLAGIPLRAADRGEGDPLVFGGGPCAFNPEPYAPFFDAVFIGEGENADLEAARLHRSLKERGASRAEILRALARQRGVYVPGLYGEERHDLEGGLFYLTARPKDADASPVVEKTVVRDFDHAGALPRQIVPYGQLVHDRLPIEILRGCNRGCRFCQAGMIYRPVRERSADTVLAATMRGLACTGYDEVSLTSLSSTDHSQIMQMLRRLKRRFHGTGRGVSLPSQRVDAFGTELSRLVAGEKKPSLTLAPEAGTQRMRDIINKGVTEDDLFAAIARAFSSGWQRMKLYFMIGLPGETDEDVAGIGELCRRALRVAKDAVPKDARARTTVKLSASVALFVPKAVTPFQWDGQIPYDEIMHRIEVLKASFPKKGIDLSWHDSATSYVEAVLARGGRECAPLIEAAWRKGARFDAWSDQFDWDAWQEAGEECGVPILASATREYAEDATLPWDHISSGVRKGYLLRERHRAREGVTTPDCTFGKCSVCGVCQDLLVCNDLREPRVASPSEQGRLDRAEATMPTPSAADVEKWRETRVVRETHAAREPHEERASS